VTSPRDLHITVCGAGNAGLAIAGDTALKGFAVTLFELEDLAHQIAPVDEAGGIEVSGDSATTSGKTGFARLARATVDPAEACADADVLMITVPAMHHAAFFDALAPHLRDGQIVLFNTAYWACLRHAQRVLELDAEVILAESSVMPYAAFRDAGNGVRISRFKRRFRVAAFPGSAGPRVFSVLSRIYEQFEAAATVFDVDIASGGNPAMTVPMVVPVAGAYFDRSLGGKLYADATSLGSRLMRAYDADRQRLAAALGCSGYESQLDFYTTTYDAAGDDMSQIMRTSNLIDWWAPADYIKQLIDEDIIYSYVPMVRVAEAVGVEAGATRAMVETMGIMLDVDYWSRGATLEDLGLQGLDLDGIRRFAITGEVTFS
jgi:opine dehydrogenase